jgi:CarboxypepD_reg-like domain/Carboxypeptidase regulatory-like domain
VRNDWDIVRHRVAIAGSVLDAGTGKPIRDAQVVITAMPAAFKKKLEVAALPYGNRWNSMLERPDKTRTRPDGLFYFLDLPDGKYSLSVSIPSYGSRYGKTEQSATVSRDAGGDAKMPFLRCALPPTLVKGKITGSGHKTGVVLARVRVKGSGERAFTDALGQYTVAGIEPGKRTLLVSAQGYRTESQVFTLAEPGASQTLNFTLTREGG